MEPKSPPDPFTKSISLFFLSIGSFNIIFEDVLPPPKFVIFKSFPSKFERRINWSNLLILL